MYSDLLNNSVKQYLEPKSSNLWSIGGSGKIKPDLDSFKIFFDDEVKKVEIIKSESKDKRGSIDFVEKPEKKSAVPIIKPKVLKPVSFPIKMKMPKQPISHFTSTAPKTIEKMNSSRVFINPNCVDKVFDFESDSEGTDHIFIQQLSMNQELPYRSLFSFSHSEQKKVNETEFISFRDIVDMDEYKEIIQSQKCRKTYNCCYCKQVFLSGCALGGHISKIHRESVKKYKKKIFKQRNNNSEKERVKFFRYGMRKGSTNN